MKTTSDDPRVTAFALGELDGPDREEIERLVEQDPELREEVDAIREMAGRLAAELGKETSPALTDDHRTRIQAAATSPVRRWRPVPVMALLAAMVLVAVGVALIVSVTLESISKGESIQSGFIRLAQQALPAYRNQAQVPTREQLEALDRLKSYQMAAPASKDGNASIGRAKTLLPKDEGQGTTGRIAHWGARVESDRASVNSSQVAQQQISPPLTRKQIEQLEIMGYISSASDSGSRSSASNFKMGSGWALERPDAEGVQHGPTTDPTGIKAYRLPSTTVPGSETYAEVTDNPFKLVKDDPLSTFSIDVDTASYSNVRRFLNQGLAPPQEAVRIEELINYFSYSYPEPSSGSPLAVNVEMHPCPWNGEHQLARIGLRAKSLPSRERPACNLVFLLDVSGSMETANKLPLLKRAMPLLVDALRPNDWIGIVTYDTTARVALEPVPGNEKEKALAALDSLASGGSTNGGAGITEAYELARKHHINGGVNRVVFATDGDFNTGVTEREALVKVVQNFAREGVFLTVLGFGEGNLKDANLEALADKGNGHYAYIDSFNEARRVLMDQVLTTLVTVAKDVKIQIEFNPAQVGAYRLIGYENRALAAKDFSDDTKDAGEMGAGQSVTALYELVPPGKTVNIASVEPLKYQQAEAPTPPPRAVPSDELMTVKLRYKLPDADTSTRSELPVKTAELSQETSSDFQFAASVTAFAMMLRNSPYKGTATFGLALNLAEQGKNPDPEGKRAEFITLVRSAGALAGR